MSVGRPLRGIAAGWRLALALALVAALGACAGLDARQRQQAGRLVTLAQSAASTCARADACAAPSPLRALGAQALADSRAGPPRHHALILDHGQDALLARLDLIRGAQRSIDLQTYIFDEDDAGRLVLDELLAAARRGVVVRVLIDQLSAMKHVQTLAALAGAHQRLQVRLYNPVLNRARISYPMYALAAACCWRRLNQRMHSKLLLVDEMVGITGGRNYQDDYYDWSPDYNFRDRDVLVAGPAAREMGANFQAFWSNRRSVPLWRLADVGRFLLQRGVPSLPPPRFARPQRVQAVRRAAADPALVRARLADAALPVAQVRFIADPPQKHRRDRAQADAASQASAVLHRLVASTRRELLIQTPYLVLSGRAQRMFADLRQRPQPPQVSVSTNSLASIDSFITYAMAYKYRRRHLRDFGFRLYEFKPFPENAPIDPEVLASIDHGGVGDAPRPPRQTQDDGPRALTREYAALRYAGFKANAPVPLKRAGVRIGLHAKSMVIDARVGVVGSHNFDPRGDHYNTENAVVIEDAAFAGALAASIRRDMEPENSWVIARRDRPPAFSGLNYSLGKMSEYLPVFDLWPGTYATSYEFKPGPECPVPPPPQDRRFRQCHVPVGNFPEVAIGFRSLLTRIFTAFGAGLTPIL